MPPDSRERAVAKVGPAAVRVALSVLEKASHVALQCTGWDLCTSPNVAHAAWPRRRSCSSRCTCMLCSTYVCFSRRVSHQLQMQTPTAILGPTWQKGCFGFLALKRNLGESMFSVSSKNLTQLYIKRLAPKAPQKPD